MWIKFPGELLPTNGLISTSWRDPRRRRCLSVCNRPTGFKESKRSPHNSQAQILPLLQFSGPDPPTFIILRPTWWPECMSRATSPTWPPTPAAYGGRVWDVQRQGPAGTTCGDSSQTDLIQNYFLLKHMLGFFGFCDKCHKLCFSLNPYLSLYLWENNME